MERIKFDPSEITGEYVEARGVKTPIFKTPVTPEENYLAMFNGEQPLWMPMTSDCAGITPHIDPENIARAFVTEAEPYDNYTFLGKRPDMFGIEWVFVPTAGGSMVQPGDPYMEDANDWEKLIKFPDVNSWDWEGSAKLNAPWFEKNKGKLCGITFLNGTGFERLISFMDFEGAAMAIIDDEQKDAVKALLNKVFEVVYVPYLENVAKWFPQIKKVSLHDDWGAQRSGFFSVNTAHEIFVPIMQRFAAKCKELGLIFELHSCGKNDELVPAYIEAGVQTWNGMYMNDKRNLFNLYGDKIILGVDVPAIATDANASAEEIEAAAKEYCEFFIRDGQCHAIANLRSTVPYFNECVYRISREMLNA